MIENLPNWINLMFILTTITTIVFFHFSNDKPKLLTALIILWSIAQSILAYKGFYQNTEATPPRFGLILIPTTLLIIYSLLPKQRNYIIDSRNTKISTFLHIIRLPMEIVLLQLFIYKMIPELMTFEGRNFDIIMGITAPIIGFLYIKQWLGKKGLLAWNILGLCLILFILFNGILSAELPFQQFGFEQPNRALLYFPFVLLPSLVVPLVIYTHITDILLLIGVKKENT